MITPAVFSASRFEHEGQHIYFLQKKLLEYIRVRKPIYLIGTRGTGKTTLMNALYWKERLYNGELKKQLDGDFSDGIIGTYFKFPETQIRLVDRWAKACLPELRPNINSTYIELYWLELCAQALGTLLARDVVVASPDAEYGVCQLMLEAIPEFRRHVEDGPTTILSIGRAARAVRRGLERLARIRADQTEVEKVVALDSPGELSKNAFSLLDELCRKAGDGKEWFFKVCMDEGEALETEQQVFINTLARVAKWPVFPVISYVSLPAEATRTIHSGLTLHSADRDVILMDELTDSDFEEVADGIVGTRLRLMTGSRRRYSTERSLGRLDINGLLETVLVDSESASAQKLQSLATSYGNAFQRDRGEASPIYQTYIILSENIDVAGIPTDPRAYRRIMSMEFRKKMVAAYLAICHKYKKAPMYASADMVLQMSDKCIRDYLDQMAKIYEKSGLSLDQFIEGVVNPADQSKGLRAAGIAKRKSLQRSEVFAPEETDMLLDGLGQLTAVLQRQSVRNKNLASPERGLFEVRVPKGSIADIPILARVREATEAGYLKTVKRDARALVFRVHTSLASYYRFSYRGAFYRVPLSMDDLEQMAACKRKADLAALVQLVALRIEKAGAVQKERLFSTP